MTPLETELYLFYSELLGNPAFYKKAKRVSMEALIPRYDAFFFDAFGTLWNRNGFVYENAKKIIRLLRDANKEIRLVTNSATATRSALIREASELGFDFQENEVWTSGRFLKTLRQEYEIEEAYYLGRKNGDGFLKENDISISENPKRPYVVITSTEKDEGKLKIAAEILKRPGAKIFVLNPDARAPELDGTRSEVSGTQSYRLFKATRCEFILAGKPFRESFDAPKKSLKRAKNILMIGDTLGTDIVGANASGLDSCLILGRNVLESDFESDAKILKNYPDFILESF